MPSIFEPPSNEDYSFIKLMYIPNITHKIKKILKPLCYNNVKFVYHYPQKLSLVFSRIKDKTPHLYESNVIYMVSCNDCDGKYVGVTSQWLKNRISLHRSDCKTGKTRCALSCHAMDNGHMFDFEHIKILDREANYRGRMFLEMYNINITENTVNFRQDVDGLSVIYSNIIKIDKLRHCERNNESGNSIVF